MSLKGFLISLAVAVGMAFFGNLPLMGLPGGLVFSLFGPLTDLVYGPKNYARIDFATAAWPAAILTTLLWPLAIPMGYALGWGLFAAPWMRWTTLGLVMVLWGLAITLFLVRAAPKV